MSVFVLHQDEGMRVMTTRMSMSMDMSMGMRYRLLLFDNS